MDSGGASSNAYGCILRSKITHFMV